MTPDERLIWVAARYGVRVDDPAREQLTPVGRLLRVVHDDPDGSEAPGLRAGPDCFSCKSVRWLTETCGLLASSELTTPMAQAIIDYRANTDPHVLCEFHTIADDGELQRRSESLKLNRGR